MADQPMDQLNPQGTVVQRLKKGPQFAPPPSPRQDKHSQLRALLRREWKADDIGLIAWIDDDSGGRWYKWDRLKK